MCSFTDPIFVSERGGPLSTSRVWQIVKAATGGPGWVKR